MPRIPLPETSGIRSVNNVSPHLSGAPGPNFGMETADALASASRAAGKTNQIGDAMVEFSEKEARSRNSLAAVKARNIFKAAQQQLAQKMAENPGSFDQFEKWGAESDKECSKALQPVLGEMTVDFRKEFEPELENWKLDAADTRNRSIIQAKVTHNTALFNTELENAAKTYDTDSLYYLLDQNEGILFHSDRRAEYESRFYQNADFYAAKSAAERDPSATLADLEETADGKFKNYASMNPNKRAELIRYCKAKDASRRSDENLQLFERLYKGELITAADIEREFSGKKSPADIKQLQTRREMVKQFEQQNADAENARKTAAEKKSSAAAKAAAERDKKEIDNVKYSIITAKWSLIPDDLERERAEVRDRILYKYSGRGTVAKQLLAELDHSIAEFEKGATSYRQSYSYKKASEYFAAATKKDPLKVYEEAGDWWRSIDDDGTVEDNRIKLYNELDLFFRLKPDATFSEARNFIDTNIKLIRQQQVSDLVRTFQQIRINTVNSYKQRSRKNGSAKDN